ncbi:MAG: hypothetical protein JWS12_28 [Candidatus Saccharibacteria bacterium]|nr:hypothetical protein [Candidatus Saccharibacteria bacterium]
MTIKERIEQDLKQALLGGDKVKVTTLRGLKSAILNVEIEKGARDKGLGDDEVLTVLAKESKKRQESADLYKQGGNAEREQAELTEKQLIDDYLPAQLSEAELIRLIDETMASLGEVTPQQMGQIIGKVKQQAGASADGALIARLVKERLK